MIVLIIDDEQLIRQSVYAQVVDMKLGIDRILMAESTKEARRIMQTCKIDIFLCDIVMPEENGIEFAKKTLTHYPESKFIFLTAHSDYKYMKEAITLQSFDYILQPAPAEELRDVLMRAMIQIRLEEKKRSLLESAGFLMDNDLDILDALGRKYIDGNAKNREFFERYLQKMVGDVAPEASYFPLYIKALSQGGSQDERSFIRRVYKDMIDEIIEPLHMKSAVFIDDAASSNALVLFCCEPGWEDTNGVMKALETIRIMCGKLLNIAVVIYASCFCAFDAITGIVAGITDKMNAIVRDVSCICLTQAESERGSRDALTAQADAWRVLINTNQIEKFRISMMHYLEHHNEGKQVSKAFLVRLHQQVSELILKKIVTSDLNTDEVFDDSLPYSDFMYCTGSLEMFTQVMTLVLERLSRKLETRERDPIEETTRYIRENIDRDVSVRELADMVGVTTEYFSRLFKKRTGQSLKKHIISEKMNAAKILLSTTDLSVTAISDRVGYNSYSNFSYTFKLMFGESPTEYRSKQGQTSK